jgi:proton glutamate symport protein
MPTSISKIFKKITLTHWIFIAMGVGVLLGFVLPEGAPVYSVISNLFLRLIKCIIVPLLFGTLVVGIAGHTGDMKQVGRLAVRSLMYFEVLTTLALVFGLFAVNVMRPGDGIALPPASTTEAAPAKLSAADMIEHIIPKSFIEAASANDVLQIVVFSVLFAIALSMVHGKSRETMLGVCESLSEVMFKFTGIVMKFAPLGIAGSMANTVSHSGIGVIMNLGKLVLTLYGTLAMFFTLIFIPVLLLAKIPVRGFWRAVRAPAAIAFATTSSDAALPDALQNMVRFGVPKRIVSFVLPVGYSFNLDGSTLYLALASVFCAQAAGIQLTLGQQLMMMFSLMLSSKGVAAVPRASFVILTGTLVTFGIPIEAAVLILGVDSLMDAARTSTNLVGNCLASAVMARWEGELDVAPEYR